MNMFGRFDLDSGGGGVVNRYPTLAEAPGGSARLPQRPGPSFGAGSDTNRASGLRLDL